MKACHEFPRAVGSGEKGEGVGGGGGGVGKEDLYSQLALDFFWKTFTKGTIYTEGTISKLSVIFFQQIYSRVF